MPFLALGGPLDCGERAERIPWLDVGVRSLDVAEVDIICTGLL